MNATLFAQEQDSHFSPALFNEVFKLRHDVFSKRLEWDVKTHNGLERDNFDDLNPYHIAICGEDGNVSGCWRALPTMGDYMLKDVFPELLQGEALPVDQDVWEISRLAVRKGCAHRAQGCIGNISVEIINSFRDFAKKNSIKSYVTVTTLGGEKILKMLGVKVRRLGLGSALQIGKEQTVGLWIDVAGIPELA